MKLTVHTLSAVGVLQQYQDTIDAYVIGVNTPGLEDAFRVKQVTKAVSDAFDRFRSLFDAQETVWGKLRAAALKIDWTDFTVANLNQYHLGYWNDHPEHIRYLKATLESGTRLTQNDESNAKRFYEGLAELYKHVVGEPVREGASIREIVSRLNNGLREYRSTATGVNAKAMAQLRDVLIYAYEHRDSPALKSVGLESRGEYERYKDQFNPEMQDTFANHVIDFILGFFGFFAGLFSSFFIGLMHLLVG